MGTAMAGAIRILPDIVDLALEGHSDAMDTLKSFFSKRNGATILEEFCARHASEAPRFAWIHGTALRKRGDRACVQVLQQAAHRGVAEARYELALAAVDGLFGCSREVVYGHMQAAMAGGVLAAAEWLGIEAGGQKRRPPFRAVQLGVEHKRVWGLVAAIELEKDRRRTAWLWRRLRETRFEERVSFSVELDRVSPRMSFEAARILARNTCRGPRVASSALRICLDALEGKLTVRERAAFWLISETALMQTRPQAARA
jgi:hypothetical protein